MLHLVPTGLKHIETEKDQVSARRNELLLAEQFLLLSGILKQSVQDTIGEIHHQNERERQQDIELQRRREELTLLTEVDSDEEDHEGRTYCHDSGCPGHQVLAGTRVRPRSRVEKRRMSNLNLHLQCHLPYIVNGGCSNLATIAEESTRVETRIQTKEPCCGVGRHHQQTTTPPIRGWAIVCGSSLYRPTAIFSFLSCGSVYPFSPAVGADDGVEQGTNGATGTQHHSTVSSIKSKKDLRGSFLALVNATTTTAAAGSKEGYHQLAPLRTLPRGTKVRLLALRQVRCDEEGSENQDDIWEEASEFTLPIPNEPRTHDDDDGTIRKTGKSRQHLRRNRRTPQDSTLIVSDARTIAEVRRLQQRQSSPNVHQQLFDFGGANGGDDDEDDDRNHDGGDNTSGGDEDGGSSVVALKNGVKKNEGRAGEHHHPADEGVHLSSSSSDYSWYLLRDVPPFAAATDGDAAGDGCRSYVDGDDDDDCVLDYFLSM